MKTDKDILTGDDLPLAAYGTHYEVHTYCTNCGQHDSVRLRKGVSKKGKTITCENCGCKVDL